MKNIELIFDIVLAIISGVFAACVITLAFAMALAKSIPELFKK